MATSRTPKPVSELRTAIRPLGDYAGGAVRATGSPWRTPACSFLAAERDDPGERAAPRTARSARRDADAHPAEVRVQDRLLVDRAVHPPVHDRARVALAVGAVGEVLA